MGVSILGVASFALGIIPDVINLLYGIEKQMPGPGRGTQKLAVARTALQFAHEEAGRGVEYFEQRWPAYQNLIGCHCIRQVRICRPGGLGFRT